MQFDRAYLVLVVLGLSSLSVYFLYSSDFVARLPINKLANSYCCRSLTYTMISICRNFKEFSINWLRYHMTLYSLQHNRWVLKWSQSIPTPHKQNKLVLHNKQSDHNFNSTRNLQLKWSDRKLQLQIKSCEGLSCKNIGQKIIHENTFAGNYRLNPIQSRS